MKRFQLGATHITTALLRHMQDIGIEPMTYLVRHMSNDWGDLGRDDKKANNDAIEHGGRLLSKYKLPDGQAIYCITEADRRSTTLMFTKSTDQTQKQRSGQEAASFIGWHQLTVAVPWQP